MADDRRSDGKKRASIDHWETVEVLHSNVLTVGEEDLGVVVEAQRPVFESGQNGRVNMSVVIRRGERMLRLFCRDGDMTEVATLRDMLDTLDDQALERITARFGELCRERAERAERKLARYRELYLSAVTIIRNYQAERDSLLARVRAALLGIESSSSARDDGRHHRSSG